MWSWRRRRCSCSRRRLQRSCTSHEDGKPSLTCCVMMWRSLRDSDISQYCESFIHSRRTGKSFIELLNQSGSYSWPLFGFCFCLIISKLPWDVIIYHADDQVQRQQWRTAGGSWRCPRNHYRQSSECTISRLSDRRWMRQSTERKNTTEYTISRGNFFFQFFPWKSHVNVNGQCIAYNLGTGMGIGIALREWEGMGMSKCGKISEPQDSHSSLYVCWANRWFRVIACDNVYF